MVSLVKYKYEGEDIKYIEGDKYDIEIDYVNVTQWQATGEAEILIEGHPNSRTGWYTPSLFSEKQGEITKGDISTFGGRKIGEAWRFGDSQIYVNPGFVGEWWISENGGVSPYEIYNSARLSLTYFRERFPGDTNPTYYYGNPVFTHWHPVDGDIRYTFKVSLEDSNTLTRTEIKKKPEFVEIISGFECSPDTCPVFCGDTICCYNSNGIPVNSFLKVESIY